MKSVHSILPALVSMVMALVLCHPALSALGAPGDVDLSFNAGSRFNDYVYSVAPQPDGKLLVGGLFTSPRILMARLNADGSPDPGFNVGAGANGIIYSMAVQPDGKILVGGAFTRFNGTNRNRIARLNADGSLDLSFDPGLGADDRIRAVALLPNGKVLIGGDFFEVNLVPRLRLARLNANGSVDTTFNPGTGADEEVYAIALQSDGRAIIGGYFQSVNDTPRNYIARLNANGSVDATFDPGAGADLDVDSVALQADGRIVIGGGFETFNGFTRPRVARLHPDGRVDESFDPGLGADFHVGAVVLEPDGKVVVGGSFGAMNGVPRANIARLNEDGSVDAAFDPGFGTDAIVNAVAVQQGKVVMGGAFKLVNGVTRNFLARLESTGAVDASFNPSTGADYPVLAVASSQGKVIVGGYFTQIGNLKRNYVARLLADGLLDASFDPGLGADNRVTSVAPLYDGRVLIGGLFTTFDGINCGRIARLTAGGKLDASFNAGAGANGDVLGVATDSEGRVVIVGEFTRVDGVDRRHVARLHTDGTLDENFNPGTGADAVVTCVAVRGNDRVVIGGDFVTVNGVSRARVAQLKTDGSVDDAFDPGLGANAQVESIAVQPDGQVLIGGQFTSVRGTGRGRVARLTAAGALDEPFAAASGADGVVQSVAVHSDGKVLIGGEFFNLGGVSRPRVARLTREGALDGGFDPGIGANDTITAVAWQADGGALIGGYFNTVDTIGRSCVARLMGDPLPPTLMLRKNGNSVVISWPANFTNFNLQSSVSLTDPLAWSVQFPTPVTTGGWLVVTNSGEANAQFFRLKGQ